MGTRPHMLLCALWLAAGCGSAGETAGTRRAAGEQTTRIQGKRVRPAAVARGERVPASAIGFAGTGSSHGPITYHGGPVMSGPLNVYE